MLILKQHKIDIFAFIPNGLYNNCYTMHVSCRALLWADRVVGHQSRFLATLEDEVDGRDSRNDFGEVADLPATVAVSGHTGWGVPMLQPGK